MLDVKHVPGEMVSRLPRHTTISSGASPPHDDGVMSACVTQGGGRGGSRAAETRVVSVATDLASGRGELRSGWDRGEGQRWWRHGEDFAGAEEAMAFIGVKSA